MLKFHIYLDHKNVHRWRLVASNGKTIADSGEGYQRYEDCLHGIQLVQQNAGTAAVDPPEPLQS